ncbi:histidine kinase [Halomarina litorea]|uniref:histidine kinase n=1 Tax=Halomarina litorea TaxID=2961595 RepID=UPI0020C4DAEC|nr:histidine kinase [Halomarina sp. BCD28]
MSTETTTATTRETAENGLLVGGIAGLVGTIAFGALQMVMGMEGVIAGAIPALYTLGPSLTLGWVIHLFHGAVLGVSFAALVSATGLRRYADSTLAMLGLGAVYGVVTTIALAWLLMPVWLQAVGFPMAPPFPNVGMASLVGHLVYGVVLAAAYVVLRPRL